MEILTTELHTEINSEILLSHLLYSVGWAYVRPHEYERMHSKISERNFVSLNETVIYQSDIFYLFIHFPHLMKKQKPE